MDKMRYPHVTQTRSMERTKVLQRPPQPVKLPSHPVFRRPPRTNQAATPPASPPEAEA